MANNLKTIEKLRADIVAVREEIAWLNDAPMPKTELKAAITEHVVRAIDDAGELRLMQIAAGDPRASFEAGSQLLEVHGSTRPAESAPGISSFGLQIGPLLGMLLGKDAIIRALHERVDALDYAAGPPLAERSAKRTKLIAELRRLETEEERLIVASEEAGEAIGRRRDADPRVVLEFEGTDV